MTCPVRSFNKPLCCNRRQFAAGLAIDAAAFTATSLQASLLRRMSGFVVAPNCYPMAADLAQFLAFAAKTPIRCVELPVGADNFRNLIPEWMVDVPLGGNWRNSLPDLKSLLDNRKLHAECICAVGFIGYPGSERLLKQRIDFAERIGVKLVNVACDPGIVAKHRDFAYAMLRDVGKYAAAKNISIALETWGGIMRNADESLRTMQQINLDNVGVNFDTGNVLLGNVGMDSQKLSDELARLTRHLKYVHLKDVQRTSAGRAITTVLGQGEIDFRKIFGVLHAADFSGPIGFDLETTRACRLGDIRESHKDMLASIDYLRSIREFDPA